MLISHTKAIFRSMELPPIELEINANDIVELNLKEHTKNLQQLKLSSRRTDYFGTRNKMSTFEINANDCTRFQIAVPLPHGVTFDDETTIFRCVTNSLLELPKATSKSPDVPIRIPVNVFRTDIIGNRYFAMDIILKINVPVDIQNKTFKIHNAEKSLQELSSSCFENKCISM